MSAEIHPPFHKVIEIWSRALLRSPFQVLVYSIHAGFVINVLLSLSTKPFPAPLKIINLVGITVFPGLVLVQLSSKRRELPISTFLTIALVVSLSYTMLSTGMLLIVSDAFSWTQPLSRPILSVWFILSNSILLLTVTVLVDDFTVPLDRIPSQGGFFRISLLGSTIIASGIFGGFILNNHSNNIFFLSFLILVAVLPIVLVYTCSSEHYPLILWSIGIALLLGHNLSYNYLGFGKEFSRILLIMSQLDYSLGTSFPRELNLHLALLYPALAQIGDVPLLYVFKYLHPVFISAIPVLFYRAFTTEYEAVIAFLSVYYVMALHLFYYMLNANTRTGIAVLFLATVVYLTYSGVRPDRGKQVILLLSIFGLAFSHWGTANLFLLANLGILSIVALTFILNPERWGFTLRLQTTIPLLSISAILLLGRAFLGNPDIGLLLLRTGMDVGDSLAELQLFSTQTDAAVALTGKRSTTTTLVRYLYLISFAFIPIGYLSTHINKFRDRTINIDRFVYESLFLVLLAASAAPFFKAFDARRIYIISAVFLASLLFRGVVELVNFAQTHLRMLPRGKPIGAIFIIVMLLLSSGVISATVTHDRSPNPIVNKHSILEDGTPRELYSLLNRELTTTDHYSSTWIGSYKATGENIYIGGSPFPTYFDLYTSSLVDYTYLRRLPRKDNIAEVSGYIHIGNYERSSDRIIAERSSNYDWGFFLRSQYSLSKFRPESRNQIYSNGPNQVYAE